MQDGRKRLHAEMNGGSATTIIDVMAIPDLQRLIFEKIGSDIPSIRTKINFAASGFLAPTPMQANAQLKHAFLADYQPAQSGDLPALITFPKLTIPILKKACKEAELATGGIKQDLLDRLKENGFPLCIPPKEMARLQRDERNRQWRERERERKDLALQRDLERRERLAFAYNEVRRIEEKYPDITDYFRAHRSDTFTCYEMLVHFYGLMHSDIEKLRWFGRGYSVSSAKIIRKARFESDENWIKWLDTRAHAKRVKRERTLRGEYEILTGRSLPRGCLNLEHVFQRGEENNPVLMYLTDCHSYDTGLLNVLKRKALAYFIQKDYGNFRVEE